MLSGLTKIVFLALGWLSLILGVIGIFLPLLPTTPLILLAAFFFSKSSTRVHSWLLRQKTLGPLIYSWEQNGVIPLRVKVLASAMIILLFSYSLIFAAIKVSLWVKGFILLIGISVMIFIWTRPSEAAQNPKTADQDKLI